MTTKFQHGLKVEDILVSSWGYNQTNIDYYEVVALRGTTQIVIRKITSGVTDRTEGSDKMVPIPGSYTGDLLRKRPSAGYRGQVTVKIESFAYAYLWDGRARHQTAAGYGH